MVTPKKVSSMCSKHATEPIKIYCETCDELICRDCTVKTHRDHNYDLVSDTFPKHRDAILACLGPVKSELASVGSTIAQLKARSSRLDGQGIEAKAQVDAEVDKLQAILEARRRELHSQIDGEVCQGKKELAARIDGHELRQAQLSSCVELLRSFGNTGPDESRLIQPRGVAISSDNTVIVVGGDHSVNKFTLEGQFIASVGSKGSGRLQFSTPWAIAYNHTNNRVYVCDTYNHRITILQHDLTFHGRFGSVGSEAGQFNQPESISVSRRGNVLVADYLNKRVQIFDANGHHLSSITHTVAGEGLRGPISVAVGPNDWVYVVEQSYPRVSVFDENG
ncbi:E3 ubiquitin-protein ligase TRIM71, partial [Geodia barretti]